MYKLWFEIVFDGLNLLVTTKKREKKAKIIPKIIKIGINLFDFIVVL
jgi:hypothetical protein